MTTNDPFIQRDSNEDNEGNGPWPGPPTALEPSGSLFDWLRTRGWAFASPHEMQYSVGQHEITVHEAIDSANLRITVRAFSDRSVLWRVDLFSVPLEVVQSVVALAERGL